MRIRRLRSARGLTQAEFGALLGVSNITVNRWERGHARPAQRTWLRIVRLSEDWSGREAEPTSRQGALPVPLTSFVGRERALGELPKLIGGARLLTLTGPAGCGKTRLAIEAARLVRARFPDGVWWVELASLLDPALVPDAVARALGVRHPANRTPLERLVIDSRPRRRLIVLDNCEHLLAGCAALAETLLAAAPELRILATSRAPLGASGEVVWPVAPLAVPDPAMTDITRLAETDSVRLFIERARARVPDMAPSDRDLLAMAGICRRLDGLPLAIELAAARLSVLSIEQIAERLEGQLRLLRSDRFLAPPRQQTLRAAFDWSYELLTPPERSLFARLAVFPGAFDLDAAETVGAGGDLAREEVLDLLDRLIAQSLVSVERTPIPGATGPRYRLLETMRVYGRERLGDDADPAFARHAAYVLELTEAATRESRTPRQVEWLDRLEAVRDDVRAALAWTIERRRTSEAARIAVAMEWFWTVRGDFAEGTDWLERILERTGDDPGPDRAAACHAAATLIHPLGAYDRATNLYEQALADWRALGDERGQARALDGLGGIARRRGDFARAIALHEEALVRFRALGDRPGILDAVTNLGVAAAFHTDYSRAEACFHEGLELARELGDRLAEKTLWNDLGDLAQRRGAVSLAVEPFERSLELARALGNRDGIAAALVNLAETRSALGERERAVALAAEGVGLLRAGGNRAFLAASLYVFGRILADCGELERGLRAMSESLSMYRELGDASGTAHTLEAFAWLVIESGDVERGARWLGTAAAAREAIPIPAYAAAALARAESTARAALGEEAFARALADGRASALDAGIDEALAFEPPRPGPGALEPGHPGTLRALTERQREVLALVAAGYSNREVAEELGVSPRTVEHHLASIYATLGVERRGAAIALAVRNGLTAERTFPRPSSRTGDRRDTQPD